MTLEAAGAYLAELRRLQRLTQPRVAAAAGITDDIVLRVEKGRGETAGGVLLRMVAFLNGSYDEVLRLMDDPQATAAGAREMAARGPVAPVW